ncbi:Pkinase-domain-containing protein [Lentinus tigrinus ALCF2SS1-7]|uniref:non-specific serine/threonine protein kinase n=1 Tax=Lentinus tigrinus ALCF2SS1-6 TaxID=1328759 RepID=A0A5C2SSV5_9APHY|nr:Pkinase-domain-containing protein [Lentinus tigrinus ALCF2SS1-6]RPD76636.1 Pkinase-domain-containing protein [Lentinus tigrinus ALCF2SS1-7]
MTDTGSPSQFPRLSKQGGDPKMIGLWKVGRTIGKGSSGRVRLARHSKTGQYAAVKIVSKTALLSSRMSLHSLGDEADRILHSIEREIVIMKLIEHPNIMRLYDVWETSTELYLILEYVEGGELFDYLCSKGRLPSKEAVGYFQQIITAIDYCHRFNIAHRDLKPENLLLDRDKNIKVADFGMAIWQGADNMLLTACGSPHYAAPEVIMGEEYDGTASDIWSCGVILYALLAGRLPFDDENLPTLLEKVKLGKFTMPTDIDDRAKDLIRRMLEKNVKKRITIAEILKHPFYTSQKPKQMKCDIPKLSDIARPLTNKDDIDPNIFANLRTLWPDADDEQIMALLMDPKPSWEKGVYHLLVQYRDKHLENYDEAEERRLAEKRAKRRKAKHDAEAKERERAMAELPPRAGPPTPSRAGARPAGPQRSASPSPVPGPSRLREAPLLAPTTRMVPSSAEGSTSSPKPPSLRSPRPQAPLPPIEIPQVEDVRVQEFLHQIAQHLQAMQAAGETPSREQADYDELFSPLTTTSPPPPLRQFGDPIQVHDDEEDPFCIVEMPREQTRPLSIRRRTQPSEDKENAGGGRRYLTVDTKSDRKSSLRSNTTAASSSTTSSSKQVQLLEPLTLRGRLRKPRGRQVSPASPMSAFSEGSFVLTSTPKQRWFGALFRIKPTSYRLLSTQDAQHTHTTCRRLLEEMGVSISTGEYVAGSDALMLSCVLADSRERDREGVMAAVRGVRFRVEIRKPSPAHIAAGYVVLLQLVLERGATSSMKLIYNRMRRDWDLDSPPVPYESVSTRELEDERFVEVVYEN